MDRKNDDILKSVGGYEEFERLVRQGRQMHDQAVAGLFAGLVSKAVRFVKGNLDMAIKKKDRYEEACESVF